MAGFAEPNRWAYVERAKASALRGIVGVPKWVPKSEVNTFRERKPTLVKWAGSCVVFDGLTKGDQLTITYPLRLREVRERFKA
jgi:hypothetical protein